MEKVKIIAVGKLKNSDENKLISEYLKKTPLKLEIKELEVKKPLDPKQLMSFEANLIREHIPKNTHLVILDPHGKQQTSKEFSDYIFRYPNLTFVIGGAFGIDKTLLNEANFILSLSNMTLPHKLARLVLVEQIYRATTIKNNHPYDK